jgi:hypothetical protein
MSTTHPRFTVRIEGSPETIFDLVADLPNYGRWLPGSQAFGGTTEVSPYPVRLGTTYLDVHAETRSETPKPTALPLAVLRAAPHGISSVLRSFALVRNRAHRCRRDRESLFRLAPCSIGS